MRNAWQFFAFACIGLAGCTESKILNTAILRGLTGKYPAVRRYQIQLHPIRIRNRIRHTDVPSYRASPRPTSNRNLDRAPRSRPDRALRFRRCEAGHREHVLEQRASGVRVVRHGVFVNALGEHIAVVDNFLNEKERKALVRLHRASPCLSRTGRKRERTADQSRTPRRPGRPNGFEGIRTTWHA